MGRQFSAICKVVALPVGKQVVLDNVVRRLRRRFRRNSAILALRRSRSVPLCGKNGPFVTSGLFGIEQLVEIGVSRIHARGADRLDLFSGSSTVAKLRRLS